MIEPERLIEVTDKLLNAIIEVADPSGRMPYPASLVDRRPPPNSLLDVSYEEAEEATAFLLRLGVIAYRGSGRRSGRG
jgi:hypothetical protein